MTPSARIAAAVDILGVWQNGSDSVDRVLAVWGRRNRYAGSGDRRAIADLVYDALRRWRSAAWVAGLPEGPRAALIGLLRLNGSDPAEFFTGAGHAPAALAPAEMRTRPFEEAPPAVRLDLPDWLFPRLSHLPEAALEPLRHRAPLDLRVNLLRADRDTARLRLAEEGIATIALALSPTPLRVTEGARRLTATRAFAEGLVEPMDAGSQAVADQAAPRPGETVLDFCAGAGGKTLALAALMGNRGRLLAHDVSPERLAQLPPRADRAGANVEFLAPGDWRKFRHQANLTLVDAPCSGSGTWRRTPDAKWRLDQPALDRLTALQDAILDEAAETVTRGGRLVYATCSLLEVENAGTVARFLGRHPEFAPRGAPLKLTLADGCDGFFAVTLVR